MSLTEWSTRFSVVIPTYNRAKLLRRAIESARGAGGEPEIVVVDDGSTDETAETWNDGLTPVVRYLRLPRNCGRAYARNVGVLWSTGRYIAFLDDDDMRLPRSYPEQLDLLDADSRVGLVYGQAIRVDASGQDNGEYSRRPLPAGDAFWTLLESNFMATPSVVVRRECLADVGLFSTRWKLGTDWDLWLRLAERYRVGNVEHAVCRVRMPILGSDQASSQRLRQMTDGLAVQAAALELPRARAAGRRTRETARKRFRNMASDLLILEAVEALAMGMRSRARASVIGGLRASPLRALRPLTLRLLARSVF